MNPSLLTGIIFVVAAVAPGLAPAQDRGGKLSNADPLKGSAQPRAPSGDLVVQGEYRHQSTGVVFPLKVAGLSRESVHAFDEKQTDVSASYHGRTSAGRTFFVGTVYSYPRPDSLGSAEAVFEDAKAAIRKNTPSARLLKSGTAPGGRGSLSLPGLQADYDFKANFFGTDVPVRSRLIVFGQGRWMLKYRFTYAAAEASRAEALMQRMVEAIGREAQRL